MDDWKFVKFAKEAVVNYFNAEHIDGGRIAEGNVYVVWLCKTLQNNKALLGTDHDDIYYEITYNGDKNEMYLDAYKKWDNKCIKIEE